MNFSNGQLPSSNQNGGGQPGGGRNDVPLDFQLVEPPTASATRQLIQSAPNSTSSQAGEAGGNFRLMQALQIRSYRNNHRCVNSGAENRIPGSSGGTAPTNNVSGDERDTQIDAAQAKLNDARRQVNDYIRRQNRAYKTQLQEQQTKIAELQIEIEVQKSSKLATDNRLDRYKAKSQQEMRKATGDIDNLNFQLQQQEQKVGLLEARLDVMKKDLEEKKAEIEALYKKNLKGDFDNEKLKEADAIHVSKIDEIQNELKIASDKSHQREMELLQEIAGLKERAIISEQKEKHLAQQLEAEKAERVRLQLKEEKGEATSKMVYDWMLAFQNRHYESFNKFSTQFIFEELMTLNNIRDGNGAGTSSATAPPRPGANLDSVVSAAVASTSASVTTTTSKKRKVNNTSGMEKKARMLEERVPLMNDVDRPAQAGGQGSDSDEEELQIVENEPDEQDTVDGK